MTIRGGWKQASELKSLNYIYSNGIKELSLERVN